MHHDTSKHSSRNIEKVFYAGPSFSAGRLRDVEGRPHSFAGNLFATEGDQVSLAGTWEKHPKYGRQFKVDHVAIDLPAPRNGCTQCQAILSPARQAGMPQDAEGLAQHLANHPEIKGIGPAKARMLAERFGGDFERALEEQPEALAKAAHVSVAAIATLREHWRKTRNVNAALTWLSAYDLTHHQASTLVEKLGNNVVAGIITSASGTMTKFHGGQLKARRRPGREPPAGCFYLL